MQLAQRNELVIADLASIRAGIAANLGAITDLQAHAYMLSSPTPPAAHVIPGQVDYLGAMQRGLDELTMKVQVFVGLVTDEGAQVLLDDYIDGSGARSVKQAVESDRTLGGAVSDAVVVSATGPQLYVSEHGPLLMCEWEVQVLAKGA